MCIVLGTLCKPRPCVRAFQGQGESYLADFCSPVRWPPLFSISRLIPQEGKRAVRRFPALFGANPALSAVQLGGVAGKGGRQL